MAYLVGMVGGDMEILTLLKANIRHKKGSFVSVVLLTLIIATSVTTILGIKDSAFQGVYASHDMVGTPDLWIEYYAYKLTDDMIREVENNARVKAVNVDEFLTVGKSLMNGNEYTNTAMLMKADGNTMLLKEDLSGLQEEVPMLKKGEIYVPQGLLSNVDGEVGQKVTLTTFGGDFEFTVKGVLLDPYFGASVIGWKRYCISEEDYNEIRGKIEKLEPEETQAIGKFMEINKADNCSLTRSQFRRQLNKATGVVDLGYGSLTKDMSIYYTTLFPQIISSILLVFLMLLLAIVLIVTVHSITMEIESNFVTFGVLKAQGFGTGKIRALFLAQYLLAELLGAVLGIAISIPLIGALANIFVVIIAVPAVLSVPFAFIAVLLGILFLLSVVAIVIVTVKVQRISPVRAISGAKKEIYFDSRLKAAISRRLLSGSLAFRQFTSAKRRYFGTFIIVGILVFFMMTINVLSHTVSSKSASESMGMVVTEIDVSPMRKLTDKDFSEIEKEIEQSAKIQKRYYYTASYFSFEGEQIMCQTYKDPRVLPPLKGRAPIYDNEIAVSPILLDEFGLEIGDEVIVGWEGEKEKYLISGTFQIMNDVGRCFVMSQKGAEKLGYDAWLWGCYSLEDDEEADKIVDSLNKKFADVIEARRNQGMMDETYQTVILFMQIIIYVFSLLFSLIVVYMVCAKTFVQERTDIGIYKAIGFTAGKLRLQFAIRFLTAAALGSCLGAAFSYIFTARILELLLYGIGITSFKTTFGVLTFLLPICVISTGFFIFAYLSSAKVKKVEIRELVQCE